MAGSKSQAIWGLAIAVAILLAKFILTGGSSLTYNEATYADLAKHFWYSSYYPDEVFLRHPPLAFLILGFSSALFGDSEFALRFAPFLATIAGVTLIWKSFIDKQQYTAGLALAILLSINFLVFDYGFQVGMYGFAFGFLALAQYQRARGNLYGYYFAIGLACMTHLFAFAYVAAELFLAPKNWRGISRYWLPIGWVVGATIAAPILNPSGDIMRLGPLGQFIRGAGTAANGFSAKFLIHWLPIVLGTIAIASLYFILQKPTKERSAWKLGTGLIALAILVAGTYVRYVLLLIPGIIGASESRPIKVKFAVAAILLSVVANVGANAYESTNWNPRAGGDVPGIQDWRGAVEELNITRDIIQTSAPTAFAHYLQQHGYEVANRDEAPYKIELTGPRELTILRLDSQDDIQAIGSHLVVPSAWGLGGESIADGVELLWVE